ncbi:MAG: glycosyltransferase family 2 protein [Chloroflexales bacterium]|nr:glycosyltransferase family 2 protein [Chloroflexales bacterium]
MLTIIIITYNSAAQIGACLEAVAQLEGEYELIVLDNASRDDSAARVRQLAPQARLIVETENWGFAGGVNRAVAQAGGEYVLLLNPDALPDPGWAAALVGALEAGAGVVGSQVLEPDGRVQSLGTALDPISLLTSHRTDVPLGDAAFVADAVHGAAMGFSSSLWARLGGFDAGFFPAYWEEVDFCRRAAEAGERVLLVPGAVVRHAEASSTGKYSAEFYGYYLRNRLRYAAKWLPWSKLWGSFRPAEHARLATAPLLDRRVARLVYAGGVPVLTLPDAAERERIRQVGVALRLGTLPADGYAALFAQLAAAQQNAVHAETEFSSRFGALARFRRAWNGVATRWYVRPNFDQQTRYNLAVQRALSAFAEHEAARAAADALDFALLAWRTEHSEFRGEG